MSIKNSVFDAHYFVQVWPTTCNTIFQMLSSSSTALGNGSAPPPHTHTCKCRSVGTMTSLQMAMPIKYNDVCNIVPETHNFIYLLKVNSIHLQVRYLDMKLLSLNSI